MRSRDACERARALGDGPPGGGLAGALRDAERRPDGRATGGWPDRARPPRGPRAPDQGARGARARARSVPDLRGQWRVEPARGARHGGRRPRARAGPGLARAPPRRAHRDGPIRRGWRRDHLPLLLPVERDPRGPGDRLGSLRACRVLGAAARAVVPGAPGVGPGRSGGRQPPRRAGRRRRAGGHPYSRGRFGPDDLHRAAAPGRRRSGRAMAPATPAGRRRVEAHRQRARQRHGAATIREIVPPAMSATYSSPASSSPKETMLAPELASRRGWGASAAASRPQMRPEHESEYR